MCVCVCKGRDRYWAVADTRLRCIMGGGCVACLCVILPGHALCVCSGPRKPHAGQLWSRQAVRGLHHTAGGIHPPFSSRSVLSHAMPCGCCIPILLYPAAYFRTPCHAMWLLHTRPPLSCSILAHAKPCGATYINAGYGHILLAPFPRTHCRYRLRWLGSGPHDVPARSIASLHHLAFGLSAV